jgi:aspartyl-tRNA(Asn)/glutamyl-tRNA(Gln) amidotransferase subunit B
LDYEAIIGLEVHAQLLTHSKMFCGCSADYAAAEPNTHVCPVCLGMPGMLPVINQQAVAFTIMTGLALHCHIASFSRFARKNYSYPDLMKGYQISQYELPLCTDGWLEVDVDGKRTRIGIQRVHLEEDVAKLFHMGDYDLVDVNRSGVPLMEIVTKADMHSAEEARQYLIKLQQILRYLRVSTGNMEEGAMRCEPNVSVMPAGSSVWGTKVEIKNLNSFRAVKLGLDYEIGRQINVLEDGERVQQVTMGWDEGRGVTVVQRSKEEAHDYRYFPEPDLPPLVIDATWVEQLRSDLAELPEARRERFMAQYGLSPKDAEVLAAERETADYFEACAQAYGNAKTVCNWVSGELFRLLKATEGSVAGVRITPDALAELLRLVDEKTINLNGAKTVFEEMFQTGRRPREIVAALGLGQISDDQAIQAIVDSVIAQNPEPVQSYRAGKEQALSYLMGQVMRAMRGKANPQVVSDLLRRALQEG